MKDPKDIAAEIMHGWSLDRGHAKVARQILIDNIAAAIQAERDAARPPENHIRLPDGRDVKVLGTLWQVGTWRISSEAARDSTHA